LDGSAIRPLLETEEIGTTQFELSIAKPVS
jgi:hypothetical protein